MKLFVLSLSVSLHKNISNIYKQNIDVVKANSFYYADISKKSFNE